MPALLPKGMKNTARVPEPADISVVVPAFNAEYTIRRTLNSILSQTVSPTQVIVVDDGSSDGTAAIVHALNEQRIVLLRQENGGVSAARNRGWKNTQSALIAFCDADDEWAPTFIETVGRMSVSYPDAVAYATGYRIIPPDFPPYDVRLTGLPFRDNTGIIVDYFALAAVSDPPVSSSSIVVRRSALEKIEGFPVGLSSGEDLLTWARLAFIGEFAYCRSTLSRIYCPRRLDFSRCADPRDPIGHALSKLMSSAPAKRRPSLERYLSRWHEMRAIAAIAQRNMPLARRHTYQMFDNGAWNLRSLVLAVMSLLPSAFAYRAFALARKRRRVKQCGTEL